MLLRNIIIGTALPLTLAACGASPSATPSSTTGRAIYADEHEDRETAQGATEFWALFGPGTADQTVNVNKYLWAASLDVLSFLPVQTVDPFTGVIVTGYGTPPGSGKAYRATVHIKDPALAARSLSVALHSKSGPVSAETSRAVEDAILSRARQLRIADSKI